MIAVGLQRIRQIAAVRGPNLKHPFTSLAHLLTPEFLMESWRWMNQQGGYGIDRVTMQEYERNLENNVVDLVKRLKARTYVPAPVRGVEIPKGNGKTRLLGIPSVEDRLAQTAVARIISAVFEPGFCEFSHGFRPKRNTHGALRAVRDCIMSKPINYVYDVDIRDFFGSLEHSWLMKCLKVRITDGTILWLIRSWLEAGLLNKGELIKAHKGTPQGSPLSPILANIYLHYVLDLWFEKKFKNQKENGRWQGAVYLVRYADDFVVLFQSKATAESFKIQLSRRLAKFGLSVAEEKSQLLKFGRYARQEAEAEGKKPGTFDFLGFTHVCGKAKNGKFAVIRLPSHKSCRKWLDSARDWLKVNMHREGSEQQALLVRKLKGFYAYFSLYHCGRRLSWLRMETLRLWFWALRRRSQTGIRYMYQAWRKPWFRLPSTPVLHTNV